MPTPQQTRYIVSMERERLARQMQGQQSDDQEGQTEEWRERKAAALKSLEAELPQIGRQFTTDFVNRALGRLEITEQAAHPDQITRLEYITAIEGVVQRGWSPSYNREKDTKEIGITTHRARGKDGETVDYLGFPLETSHLLVNDAIAALRVTEQKIGIQHLAINDLLPFPRYFDVLKGELDQELCDAQAAYALVGPLGKITTIMIRASDLPYTEEGNALARYTTEVLDLFDAQESQP